MVRSKGPVFREMRVSIFLKGRRVLSYAIKVSWSRNMFRNIRYCFCTQSGAWHLEMTPNYEWIPVNPASSTIAYNAACHHCFLQLRSLHSPVLSDSSFLLFSGNKCWSQFMNVWLCHTRCLPYLIDMAMGCLAADSPGVACGCRHLG